MFCSHGGSGVCGGNDIVISTIVVASLPYEEEQRILSKNISANIKWVLLVDFEDKY